MTQHTDFLRILGDEPSSFEHGKLDQYDFQALALFSKSIAKADERSLQLFGRSMVQDAFFALRGHAPKAGDEMAASWATTMADPSFERLRMAFGSDFDHQATAVLELAEAVERSLRTPVDSTVADDEQTFADGFNGNSYDTSIDPQLVEQAAEDAEMMDDLIASIGASLDGSPPQVYEEALELSKLFDLRSFKDLLGFAKTVIGAASRIGKGGSSEFTGYRLGEIQDKTLPMQLVKLAQGDIATQIAMMEQALTYRDYNSDQPQGKGPAVMLRDKSGSMGYFGGKAHRQALSFEMALAAAFNEDGRDLVSIPWATEPHAPYTYGEGGIGDHLRIAPSGGTKPLAALKAGVAAADEYVSGADILMTTDADFKNERIDLDDLYAQACEMLKPFRENGGRVWVIIMGRRAEQVDPREVLWADGWCAVDAINPGQSLAHLLAQMAYRPTEQGGKVVID